MNPANPNVAASVRARLLNVAKAQGVDSIRCWCDSRWSASSIV